MTDNRDGWAFPRPIGGKAHYFDGQTRRSRCGRWAFFGKLEPGSDPYKQGPDDCAVCAKKIKLDEAMRGAR